MTIIKVKVDEKADELKRILYDIAIVKSVEEEYIPTDGTNTQYIKIKKILDAAKGQNLFKDIEDPIEWQRQIRKEYSFIN